jgi:CDP-diacylglycerol---glycerol-3-phosphate 3-phosphatidyltransferase
VLNNADVRGFFGAAINPVARGLLKIGVSPDAVTLVGALGAQVSALALFTTGHFLAGSILVLIFVLSDLLDGTMARISGRSGPWGAFLDSVLDRMTDGILVGSVALYLAMNGKPWTAGAAIVALVAGQVVSYAKARAESVGLDASGGIGERAERLIVLLTGTFLTGFGLTLAIDVAVWILAALSLFTVGQRVLSARKSARTLDADGASQ